MRERTHTQQEKDLGALVVVPDTCMFVSGRCTSGYAFAAWQGCHISGIRVISARLQCVPLPVSCAERCEHSASSVLAWCHAHNIHTTTTRASLLGVCQASTHAHARQPLRDGGEISQCFITCRAGILGAYQWSRATHVHSWPVFLSFGCLSTVFLSAGSRIILACRCFTYFALVCFPGTMLHM